MPERGEPYYFLYIYDNTMNLLKHIVILQMHSYKKI